MREGMYYQTREDGYTACALCPRGCVIKPGGTGFCRVRQNRQGILYALNYGKYTALALDPIEKKPLYHFFPGSLILSIGTFGCSFHCSFCQNWQIAHAATDGEEVSPQRLAAWAAEAAKQGSIGVAYTYSEPLMWYEFVLEAAQEVKKAGLKNVLVTNGFIRPEPFSRLLPFIDALNIDVKGFTGEFYQKIIKGEFEPVLAAAEMASQAGKHVEITTLLIPGLNDSGEELTQLVDWIAGSLGPEVPLHFSRYFPNYRLDLAPTPIKTLEAAQALARQKLQYVHLGNV
ncbi:AmmeMemoRadiSam system radical SAM enzyme [Candidatus Formimonas warabiya]|uniref:AmmeMemoRadiSam system radical SAM enzyme n=2 Tax=Formimonas warabiya TaxID=1761012 RepID=A0A3G1L216_FORW1|nr:AmmeMemoRadiSam system radical SAM enzyme [Candidatus Formimonas warabiya]